MIASKTFWVIDIFQCFLTRFSNRPQRLTTPDNANLQDEDISTDIRQLLPEKEKHYFKSILLNI